MLQAYIALGSNIEKPIEQLKKAIVELDCVPNTNVLRASSLYQNPAVGITDQPDFINAVVKVTTSLPAEELLSELLTIENNHHRVRREKNGPRTLDLDLLLYEQLQIDTHKLQIPHPRMKQRAFVLLPLAEIEPDLILPCGFSVQHLLSNVDFTNIAKVHEE